MGKSLDLRPDIGKTHTGKFTERKDLGKVGSATRINSALSIFELGPCI